MYNVAIVVTYQVILHPNIIHDDISLHKFLDAKCTKLKLFINNWHFDD